MDLDACTEARIRLLCDPCNRTVLTLLDDADGPVKAAELAERLVSRDVAVVSASTYDDRVERTLLSLHHERLPKLADAGLIEYDRESNVATYSAPATPDVDWPEGATIEALGAYLGSGLEADEGEIGVIEGRESAIEYGRRLADEAEEELFCMYVRADLLREGCIRRARAALERGVTMYVGSGNAEVRELTRTRLPDATIWEPQLDWLNAPTYPRVGRLVLADRRRVMLAILDEPDLDESHPGETALVGDGEANPLVVLVRELMGRRLDHLDHQSDRFRSELP